MNKEHRIRKLPIAIAAALAFLAIAAVENAKARPLDLGGGHHHYHHRYYGQYGWYNYGYRPYKYYPRSRSSYYRYR